MLCVRQSVNPGAVRFTKSCPCSRWFSDNDTRRSESGYGRRFSNTPLTRLNIAVLAPMPSASVSTATAVKPGFFSSWRKANLRSFMVGGSIQWVEVHPGGLFHWLSDYWLLVTDHWLSAHSVRSASIGSKLAARRAGSQHASRATPNKTSAVATNV